MDQRHEITAAISGAILDLGADLSQRSVLPGHRGRREMPIPMARNVHPLLTTVRQPIRDLGETAFEVLYAMMSREAPAERDIALPTRLMCRESCGCQAGTGRLAGVTDLSAARPLRS